MPAARTTAPIARWLVKSEPDAFSWDQQVANGVEPWTGVRNHLAKKNLMAMKKGDLAFFYHSNIGKEVVGVVEVAREAYPDPSAEEGSPWVCVDMRAVGPMPKPVGLAAIKAEPALAEVALIRHRGYPQAHKARVLACSFAGPAAHAGNHRPMLGRNRHDRKPRLADQRHLGQCRFGLDGSQADELWHGRHRAHIHANPG